MISNDLDHDVSALRHGTSFGLSTAIVAGSDLSRNQQMTPADLLMEPRHHSRGYTRSEFRLPRSSRTRPEAGPTTTSGGITPPAVASCGSGQLVDPAAFASRGCLNLLGLMPGAIDGEKLSGAAPDASEALVGLLLLLRPNHDQK